MLQAKLPFFGRAAYLDDELSRVEKLTRRVLVLSMKGGAADTLSNEKNGLVALEMLRETYTLRYASSKTAISRARRDFHLKYDDLPDGIPGLLAKYYTMVRERTALGDAPDDVACVDLLCEALTGESNRTCHRDMGPIVIQWKLKDTGLEEILEQLMRIAPTLDKPKRSLPAPPPRRVHLTGTGGGEMSDADLESQVNAVSASMRDLRVRRAFNRRGVVRTT
mmetsp:Transcript_24448/g.75415  ORF Transcript_24448/g.75415 Transcript_24448/m.75415 type:complete len:222 (-) Transcript_24448:33-698(-)